MRNNAIEAFDVVTAAGFATIDQGFEAMEKRLAEPGADGLSVPDWIRVLKAHAGTDEASLRNGPSKNWRGARWYANFSSIPSPGRFGWHVSFWAPHARDEYYGAALSAYQLLRAERRFLAQDLHRVFRRSSREPAAARLGPHATSAFAWYVWFVDTLTKSGCRAPRRHAAEGSTSRNGGAP